jgi:hypothetical protein
MDVPEDYIDYVEENAAIEQMAREGMGEEADIGAARGPPPLPRRYNMVISTTEYHKLIAARDNIVHPKLRTGANTRGQAIFMQVVREEFPDCEISMAYSKSLQIMMRDFMSGPQVEMFGILDHAYKMASDLHNSSSKKLREKGYVVPDIPALSPDSKRAWSRWQTLQSAYQRLRRKFETSSFATETITDRRQRILLTGSGWAFGDRGSKRVHVAPISALLMSLHSMELQAKTLMACDITRPDLPILSKFYKALIDVQRRIVIKCGETGHDIAKGPEALCKTYASDISGGHHGYGPSSFEKMADKYREKASSQSAIQETEELITLCKMGTTVEECTEMSGMAATFGYPVIDVESSGANARATGAEEDTTVTYAVEETLLLFQHLALKNYVKIRSDYPPITFRKNGTTLERLAKAKFLDIQDGSYPLQDWRHAEMHDMFQFMYHEDYLSLIADKSTLEPQSLAREFYIGSLSEVTIKRLVTKVLNTERIDTHFDVESFAQEVWPNEWRRCRLVPKELEHKWKARMFVVLPDMIRRALSIIQENVKELFFPVIPYTSMAMSGQELSEALHRSTHGEGKYKLELDLSSWNLKFRQFLTKPFGYLMDRMAGVSNLFGGSHRFLAGAEFCVSHRDTRNPALERMLYPADRAEDTDMLWHNDESGKEGIEQRFWTVITEVMIYRCLYRHKLPFTLMGQGDNQTLVIDMMAIPVEDRGRVATDIEEDIELGCAELNHICKPVEFLGSFSVLTYSKNFFVNGRQIPQCVKQASRITHGSSDALESLEDDLGGIASSSYTASLNAPFPTLLSTMGAIHFYAHCHLMWKGNGPYTNTENVEAGILATEPTSWVIPSVLGGLPIVPLGAYIYKGDPDPLSHAVASIRLYSGMERVRQYMAYLDSPDAYVPQPKRAQLVLNPYGLPLLTVRSGASVMQDFTLGYLCGVRNLDVNELANVAAGGKTSLLDAIAGITPFIPAMVEDMISASVLGRADKVAKKFSAAGTLLKLAPPETIALATAAALRRIRSVNLHSASARTFSARVWAGQSYDVAERLRLRWGLGPGGIVGASVAQPLDYTILREAGPGVQAVLRSEYNLTVTGPCPPYLGSKTLERRSTEKYQIETTPGTIDLAKMVLSMTAGAITPNVEKVYKVIIASRTDLELEEILETFPHTSSGTPGHRYESMQGSRAIGPVGNPGPRGWVAVDTDNVPGISGSAHDYPVPVQSFMSCVTAAAVACARVGGEQRVFRIALDAQHYPELPDADRNSSVEPPALPPLRHNPLCHIPSIKILRVAARLGVPVDQRVARVGLLTGLFVLHGTCSQNARAAAELGDERTLAQVDVAGALACGADALMEALTRAAVQLFIWHMTWFTEEQKWRHDDQVLCDNLASSLAKSTYAVFTHPGMQGECIELLGVGRENPGSSGYRAGVDKLRRVLASEIRSRVRIPEECLRAWEATQFPHSAQGAPPYLLTRLQMSITAWCAFLRSDTHSLGPLKQAIRTTWKRLGDDGPLAIGINSALGLRKFYRFLHVLLGPDVGQPLELAGPPKVLPFDMAQSWRRMRQYRPRATGHDRQAEQFQRPLPEPQQAVLEHAGTALIRAPTLGACESVLHTYHDRLARIIGRRSTAPAVWAPLLAEERGPLLVAGTGSGGVQWACAHMGIPSFGLDLASTIPPERTARTGWKPADIMGLSTAVLSAAMWNSDGDWYGRAGQLALSEQRFRTVVIDLESGSKRHGPEALTPLALAGYTGVVLWRLFPTLLELNAIVSWLSARGSLPRVYCGSTHMPTERESAPIILRFRHTLNPAPDTGSTYIVRLAPVTFARPASAESSMREAMGDLTGGLCFETDIDAAAKILATGCAGSKRHRDATHRAQGLMYLRLTLILSHISKKLRGAGAGDLSWLQEAPPYGQRGPLQVAAADKHVQYLWTRVVPRIVGCVLAMRQEVP